jgi:hypothetical protein
MDGDTTFRCWLEMMYQRHHWIDALSLLREEVAQSQDLKSTDRVILLKLLNTFESAQPSERESIARSMFDVLVHHAEFNAQYSDFASKYIAGEPDDRRDG